MTSGLALLSGHPFSDSLAVNHLGKPDAGNPPAPFYAWELSSTSSLVCPAYSTPVGFWHVARDTSGGTFA